MASKRSISSQGIINQIIYVVLYVLASFGTCRAMFTLYTSVAYVGRMLEYTLPITTVCFIPLFLLIMYRRFNNAVGNRMKWKIMLGAVITTSIVSLYSLISVIIISSKSNGLNGTLTPFFPIDAIVIDSIALLLSIGGGVFTILKRSWLSEKAQPQEVKEYSNVLTGLYLFVATFGFGAFLRCYEILIDSDFDPNLPWIFANYLMIALPTIGLIFKLVYNHMVKPANKRVAWIALMSIFAFLVIVSYVWAFTGFAINPYYYSQSTQCIFIAGFAFINMPVEIFVILITCVAAIGLSSIRFIKNGNK